MCVCVRVWGVVGVKGGGRSIFMLVVVGCSEGSSFLHTGASHAFHNAFFSCRKTKTLSFFFLCVPGDIILLLQGCLYLS
jgi:hypothetical protein